MHGAMGKDLAQWHAALQGLLHLRGQTHGEQRVAAQGEEVGFSPDVLNGHRQQLAPEGGHGTLGLGLQRGV
jgi:hypothetical protein